MNQNRMGVESQKIHPVIFLLFSPRLLRVCMISVVLTEGFFLGFNLLFPTASGSRMKTSLQ